jgi:hypothetical protein
LGKRRARNAAAADAEGFDDVERALDVICEEELLDKPPARKPQVKARWWRG